MAENDPHGAFRDLCLLYGDFNRGVFLEEILNFLAAASPRELAEVRAALRGRARPGKGSGPKGGRPEARHSEAWMRLAFRITWRRHVEKMNWPAIARAEGIAPTKPNQRTLRRRRDQYAELLWHILPAGLEGEALEAALKQRRLQLHISYSTGMPFATRQEECAKLVLELAPRGERRAAALLDRRE